MEEEVLEKLVIKAVNHLSDKYGVKKIDVLNTYLKAYDKLQTRYVYKNIRYGISLSVMGNMSYTALDMTARYYKLYNKKKELV